MTGCGCCGMRVSDGADWCGACDEHVLPATAMGASPEALDAVASLVESVFGIGAVAALSSTLPPWERTWEAQHGEPCPYQEGRP